MDFLKNLKSKTEISTDIKLEYIALSAIQPDKDQVRKTFNESDLQDLSASIKQQGIQNPIHLLLQDGKYTIITGERRYRASQLVGLEAIPCIVHKETLSSKDIKLLQLIENLQREDLTGVETARGFLALKETGISQTQVARELGVSESYVSKGLAILKKLPEDWLLEIENKKPKASIYDIYNSVAKFTSKRKRESAYSKFLSLDKGEEESANKIEVEVQKEVKQNIELNEQDYIDAWERIKVMVKRDKSKLSQIISKKLLRKLVKEQRGTN